MAKKKKWYENPEGKSEVGEHRDVLPNGPVRGRGAGMNPGNRFETVRLHVSGEHLDRVADERANEAASDGAECSEKGGDPSASGDAKAIALPQAVQVKTQVFPDKTQTIINRVQFREMGFDWTLNPYRGCEHGCVYCYARPYHEYLGFSSGIDFETKIMAKFDAPELLEKELAAKSWKPETIVMSAITDCWQPLEDELRISRRCLEILTRARQPTATMTRSKRILRDIDLLAELARFGAARVAVTITTLDHSLAASMEPRASSPSDRLRTMREMSAAGVPVVAMIAPVIPGLTDRELPALLGEISAAGATTAVPCMLRLPYQNKSLFFDWLQRKFPARASHIESLLRDVFNGKLYDSSMAMRGGGEGGVSAQIHAMFTVFARRYGLDRPLPALDGSAFRRPMLGGQMALF